VLLGDVASAPIKALLAGLGPGRRATAPGLLYAVPDPRGWYPVLIPGEGTVHGMVHEAGSVDVAALDRFEGLDPQDPKAGEYRREPVSVTPEAGAALQAHAYLYNRQPAAAFELIAHGDFARWLREGGHSVFAG
jgi:gamma-glutamylcyclotransferase (GGCT)/AIG2-like uncharacterized protein YtfP